MRYDGKIVFCVKVVPWCSHAGKRAVPRLLADNTLAAAQRARVTRISRAQKWKKKTSLPLPWRDELQHKRAYKRILILILLCIFSFLWSHARRVYYAQLAYWLYCSHEEPCRPWFDRNDNYSFERLVRVAKISLPSKLPVNLSRSRSFSFVLDLFISLLPTPSLAVPHRGLKHTFTVRECRRHKESYTRPLFTK